MSELALIRATQSSIENQVGRLSTRVDALEKIVEATKSCPPISVSNSNPEILKLTSQINNLAQKCDDSENRLRRDNLLFFGIEDAREETWEQSESLIISLWSDKLDISLTKPDIERAHRIGRFQEGKHPPITVKLVRFKDKTTFLSAGPEPKGLTICIREDFQHASGLQGKSCTLMRNERALLLR